MVSGRLFRQILDKFIKSPVGGDARVQVILPNGEFYDITGAKMMAKPLGPCAVKLYEGKDILRIVERDACAPVAESWSEVQEYLVNVT
jgi:hypothetical protein